MDDPRVEALAKALEPFRSGGDWGKWKAWLVEGTRTMMKLSEGLDAAQTITKWQVAVDAALAHLAQQPPAGGDDYLRVQNNKQALRVEVNRLRGEVARLTEYGVGMQKVVSDSEARVRTLEAALFDMVEFVKALTRINIDADPIYKARALLAAEPGAPDYGPDVPQRILSEDAQNAEPGAPDAGARP